MLCLVLPSRSSSSTFSPFCVGRPPHPRHRQRLGLPLSTTLRLQSPRGRHRLVSIQSITLPQQHFASHSHSLRHSSGPSPPLHPYRIATFIKAGSPHLLVNLRGPSTPPHPHRIATLPLSQGPPSPFLQPHCVLHARPGPSPPGSTIESLHLPSSPAHSSSWLPQAASTITHSCFNP